MVCGIDRTGDMWTFWSPPRLQEGKVSVLVVVETLSLWCIFS